VLAVRELVRYLRAYGPVNLFRAAFRKLLYDSRRLVVLELPLCEFTPARERAARYAPGIRVRPGQPGDVPEMLALLERHGCWRRGEELHRMFRGRGCVFVAVHGGRIVGYVCAGDSVPPRHGFARALAIEPDCAYANHAFVAPQHRGRGLYPALVAEVVRGLRRQGYSRVVAVCDPRNRSAMSSHLRVGMKPVGELEYTRILGVARSKTRATGGEGTRAAPTWGSAGRAHR